MKTKCHGRISSFLSEPAGSETGTLPLCKVENIETSILEWVLCILTREHSLPAIPSQMPAWFHKPSQKVTVTEWPDHKGRGCGPESQVLLPNVKELLIHSREVLKETRV